MSIMTRLKGLLHASTPQAETKSLQSVPDRGWVRILESFTGAWQSGVVLSHEDVTRHAAVYACATLIASDIAKLRVRLMGRTDAGVWRETNSPAFSGVLQKPNPFQTRIQFWEQWILSKLLHGNTYVLKSRDLRTVVDALYILDASPGRVTPLITDDGSVFYRLSVNSLAGIEQEIIVPGSEIIHDRFNCIGHPLVGCSPIYAAGLAASQGIRIQRDSLTFFENRSTPSGILVAEGEIGAENAKTLKTYWEENYGGNNSGKIAVLGGGMKFEPLRMSAADSQLIEQLKWTSETIASVFHVPAYKIGLGAMPTYNNIQSLNVEYYSQALQRLIEDAEVCLDEGLGLPPTMGTEFDLDGLLRMDSNTQVQVLKEAVGAGVMSPNEARAKVDLPPVDGGDTPYLQQQNYSLGALAKRDAKADPFGAPAAPATVSVPAPAGKTGDPLNLSVTVNGSPSTVKRTEILKHDERGRILEFRTVEEDPNG
jgi:HK97 family phage portal protein